MQLNDERPTEKWGIEALEQYAQARHQEIEAEERSLALVYWRLGLALNLARRQFTHGQWSSFLGKLGIEKTRASKSRAIQRSFAAEESLQGMSVTEAYRQRQRKICRPPSKKQCPQKQDHRVGMVDWLLDVCKNADFFSDEIGHANSKEAAALLPAIEGALEELTKLRARVKERIDTQLCPNKASSAPDSAPGVV